MHLLSVSVFIGAKLAASSTLWSRALITRSSKFSSDQIKSDCSRSFLAQLSGFCNRAVYIGVLSDFLAINMGMGEADGLKWALISLAPFWAIASVIMLLNQNALRRYLA